MMIPTRATSTARRSTWRRLLGSAPVAQRELIKGDVVEEVSKLKEQPCGNIAVLGSGELLRTLIADDLVDESFAGDLPDRNGQRQATTR